MKLSITIEQLKTKSKKNIKVGSFSLRTSVAGYEEIHAMGEVPSDSPLGKVAEEIIMQLMESRKKSNDTKTNKTQKSLPEGPKHN